MLRYERQHQSGDTCSWEIFEAPTIPMLVALIRAVDAKRESYTREWVAEVEK